jgi:hypothetical protein
MNHPKVTARRISSYLHSAGCSWIVYETTDDGFEQAAGMYETREEAEAALARADNTK